MALLKALRLALAGLPLALVSVVACGSADETNISQETRPGAVSSSVVGGYLDTMTKGVLAVGLTAHGQVAVTCSGSLIAPNVVLTARHCVNQIGDGSSPQVICGTSQFTARYEPRVMFVSTDAQPTSDSKLYPVKEIHEAPGSNEVCGFDLALMVLSNGGIPETEATPIEPVLDHAPGAKQAFAAVGYGLQDPNDELSSGTRMRFDKSSVTCVGSKCPLGYEAEDDEWVGKSPVCSGDSGGPALDAEGRVFGVTSRGDDQCTFAIYSNVANWADFVRSTALAAATAGGYTPAPWVTDTSSVGSGGGGASGASGGSGGKAHGGTSNANGGSSPIANGGSPSAAGSDSSATAGSSSDPLGMSCTGNCPDGYQCYSATGTPPGICVPPCGDDANSCPERYSCSASLKVCTPKQATTKTAHIEGSCAVSPGVNSARGTSAFALLLGLSAVWLGRRRRQLA